MVATEGLARKKQVDIWKYYHAPKRNSVCIVLYSIVGREALQLQNSWEENRKIANLNTSCCITHKFR